MDIVSFAIGMSAAGDKTELLENVEIPVDFSNGNQTVEAEEGKAIKSAVIQKPETLVAENIAKDVNIAGIIGTLESGGGEGEFSADIYFESGYKEINMPNAEQIRQFAFYHDTVLTNITMPKVKLIDADGFNGCDSLAITSLPESLTWIGSSAFQLCKNLALTSLPSGIRGIDSYAFRNCTGLTSMTFEGKPTSTIYSNVFTGCTNLTTINVPWAEGEVANAPWGATNATINYNYTGG